MASPALASDEEPPARGKEPKKWAKREIPANAQAAEARPVAKEPRLPSSMPLTVASTRQPGNRVLVEAPAGLDLTGDAGAVGRVVVTEDPMLCLHLDIKAGGLERTWAFHPPPKADHCPFFQGQLLEALPQPIPATAAVISVRRHGGASGKGVCNAEARIELVTDTVLHLRETPWAAASAAEAGAMAFHLWAN